MRTFFSKMFLHYCKVIFQNKYFIHFLSVKLYILHTWWFHSIFNASGNKKAGSNIIITKSMVPSHSTNGQPSVGKFCSNYLPLMGASIFCSTSSQEVCQECLRVLGHEPQLNETFWPRYSFRHSLSACWGIECSLSLFFNCSHLQMSCYLWRKWSEYS